MIRSMTGAGRARKVTEDFEFLVRIRAVNSRYLDVNIRIPQAYADFEHPLRQTVVGNLGRGKIDVYVEISDHRPNAVTATVNRQLVDAVLDASEYLSEKPGLNNDLDASTLLSMPGILVTEPTELADSKHFLESLQEVVREAIADLVSMREAEGARLQEDLQKRLVICRESVETIMTLAREHKNDHLSKLLQRIEELKEDLKVDEQRLEQEVALLVDRSDITEEIVRLRSHIEHALMLLEGDGVVGKKLDFFVQEMMREVNTIGAKSRNLELARMVIDVKAELEKIREQVQNVE